jgi:phage shock protein C
MKRLHLSQTDKKIAGVFGGMGEVYNIDPTLLRLGAVLLAFWTVVVPLLITYIVAWIIIPKGPLPAESHAVSAHGEAARP